MAAVNLIGLDIGTVSIRAAETSNSKDGPVISNFGHILLPPGPCRTALCRTSTPSPRRCGSGQIWTYDSSKTKTNVCLTTAEPGAASHFVTAKTCPALTDASALWTVSYQEKTYGASYVIKDHNGSCLVPTNLDDPKLPAAAIFKGSTTVSKLVVAACDGSKLQKWNAPANIEDPTPLKEHRGKVGASTGWHRGRCGRG
ncbi:hypothetical protein ACPPVO_52610 [Dactylosporangium sp. McL0621]|uniref:hypothetical protein n=1 Tax=Dactylosporangium sp. McL0621 TaxID=3415678 RepID=UPI003CF5E670